MANTATLKHIFVCATIIVALTGCDWVKGQLGMPTSEDIAMMKSELEAKQAMQQQKLEEEARMKFVEDSLAKVAALNAAVEGYHVIIGSFRDYSNADALEKVVKELGYSPKKIMFKNGYMMVSAGGYSTLKEAVAQMEKIQELKVCPSDVWVYSARQDLHAEN